jgi:uncharacterized membrane protein YfcA
MDISSRFSLTDFLAYLFPGVFTATGFYFLLRLTPLEASLANFQTDLNTGILFLVISFILGVIVSGIAEILTKSIRHKNDAQLPLIGLEKDVKRAFKSVFGGKENFEWTRTHFYLCRSIITQYMPNEIQGIQRQSSLRQLRMNLLPSIVIWIFAGLGWGWRIFKSFSENWGILLIATSIILGTATFMITINRMKNNDEREIRETLVAFLIGFKTGLFK